jgi:hypothetical protein
MVVGYISTSQVILTIKTCLTMIDLFRFRFVFIIFERKKSYLLNFFCCNDYYVLI